MYKEIILNFNSEKLIQLTKEYEIEGSSGSKYTIKLNHMQCSCPDFIKRRSHYSIVDIRRACKHIARLVIDKKLNTKLSENIMIQAFVRVAAGQQKGVRLFNNFYEVKINEHIRGKNPFYILTPLDDSPWAQVIFFSKKSYEEHGYNIDEKRWGYHNNPFPAGFRNKYNWVMEKICDKT